MAIIQCPSQLYFGHTKAGKNCVCVDDFGVKYSSKDDANNLLDSLKKHYAISTYWEGRNYLKLTIYWNYRE